MGAPTIAVPASPVGLVQVGLASRGTSLQLGSSIADEFDELEKSGCPLERPTPCLRRAFVRPRSSCRGLPSVVPSVSAPTSVRHTQQASPEQVYDVALSHPSFRNVNGPSCTETIHQELARWLASEDLEAERCDLWLDMEAAAVRASSDIDVDEASTMADTVATLQPFGVSTALSSGKPLLTDRSGDAGLALEDAEFATKHSTATLGEDLAPTALTPLPSPARPPCPCAHAPPAMFLPPPLGEFEDVSLGVPQEGDNFVMSPEPSGRTLPSERGIARPPACIAWPGVSVRRPNSLVGEVYCPLTPPDSPPVVGRGCLQHHCSSDYFGAVCPSSNCEAEGGPSSVAVPRLKLATAGSTPWLQGPSPSDSGPGPGAKAAAVEASTGEAPSIFAFLRSHFADVDVDNNRQVDESKLTGFIVSRTRRRGQLPAELEPLLRRSARRCYQQAVLRDCEIRVEDWIHFGLLIAAAPSPLAHHLLNQRLRQELARNPFLLKDILGAFEAADTRGAGVLGIRDLESAFLDGAELACEMGLTVDEEEEGSAAGGLSYHEPEVDYYQFAAHCLGYRRIPVVLHWYDISNGYAQWVPPSILGGRHFKGVWHTGIVVFGKEYWYGGKVLSSEPGNTPFPPGPTRATPLGSTLRTREELEDFLRFEVAPRYTRDKYDVLRHNCNHFTEEVTAFLIQGGHIPDEARFQPEAVMSTPLLLNLRPCLNAWLGGFEADGCDAEIDDLMTEWRARLWPGDFALFVKDATHHEPVRLVQVSNVDAWRGVCDVTYFQSDGSCWDEAHADAVRRLGNDVRVLRLGSCVHSGSFWDWRPMQCEGVPLSALRPASVTSGVISGTVSAGLGLTLLRSVIRITNPEIQKHLLRKAVVYAHCPQGHSMRSAREAPRRAWGLAAPSELPCGVCGVSLAPSEPRMECPACRFCLCGACDRRGLFKGYYSLGSIDRSTAGLMLQETAWIRYKAQRYLAAAGVGCVGSAHQKLEPDVWRMKVAPRLYGDLGLDLPCKAELMEQHARFLRDGALECSGLDVDGFAKLLFELLSVQATVISL